MVATNSQQKALIDCCSPENFENNALHAELMMLTQLALLNENELTFLCTFCYWYGDEKTSEKDKTPALLGST